jgi:hypothetical protein
VAKIPVVHLEQGQSPPIKKKKKSKRLYWDTQWLGGNWFMKKNLKSKISWHCPFEFAL